VMDANREIPRRPRRLLPVILMAALGGLAIAAAVVTTVVVLRSATAPETFTLTGTLTLRDPDPFGEPCVMSGGYSDINAGAQVVVTGAAGQTLALGHLQPGAYSDAPYCRFPFTVPQVPAGESFYAVEVTHRGKVQYTEERLRRPIDLTLGD
jgi:hypothetical protein